MIMFNYYLWRRTIHSNNNQRVKKKKRGDQDSVKDR